MMTNWPKVLCIIALVQIILCALVGFALWGFPAGVSVGILYGIGAFLFGVIGGGYLFGDVIREVPSDPVTRVLLGPQGIVASAEFEFLLGIWVAPIMFLLSPFLALIFLVERRKSFNKPLMFVLPGKRANWIAGRTERKYSERLKHRA